MIKLVRGEMTREEAVTAYRNATRRYIRRQMTWFKADDRIDWLDAEANTVAIAMDRAERYLSTASSRP
jgi:tRNA dimethylallyltransferase